MLFLLFPNHCLPLLRKTSGMYCEFYIKQVPRNAQSYNAKEDRVTGCGLPCSREIFLEKGDSLGSKDGDKEICGNGIPGRKKINNHNSSAILISINAVLYKYV